MKHADDSGTFIPELTIAAKDFVWAVGSLCNLHRRPFDANLVQRAFPPPHSACTLMAALRSLEFAARLVRVDAAAMERGAFPCIAFIAADADACAQSATVPQSANEAHMAPHVCVMVIRCDQGRLLYFPSGSNEARVEPIATFALRYSGWILTVPTAQQGNVDEDDVDGPARTFGFRWFIAELARHRSVWRDVLIASLIVQLIGLATPLCSQIIIDKVIVHHSRSTLVVIASALVVFVLFSTALGWIRQYLVSHTGNRVDAVLASAVFRHLLHLPLRYFEHRPTGVLAARMSGIESIREFLSGAAILLLLDLPFLLLFLAVMFAYSAWLSLVTLGVLLLVAGLSFAVAPLLQSRLNEQFLLGARNQAFLTEYIAGAETVKSLQMEPQLERRFDDYLGSYLRASFSTRQLANSYNAIATGLEQLLNTAILCLGAWLVMRGPDFTLGMLVAFQMFAARVSQPMLKLVGLWQQFQQAAIAVRRLGDIMDVPVEPWSMATTRVAGHGGAAVEFRGAGFRYGPDRAHVLLDFNLTIKPGECVVVMGPSGAGKSTLTRLLQGFLWPTSGQVLVDGRDTRHLAVNELRGHFGVVPQETMLFSGTVLENLLLANPLATFEMAVQAAKLAEIHHTIEALPSGYNTTIGERGAGLSGGQKQRIAIARALLKRPRMLIFDEATSGLDGVVAEQFAATIARLKGKVTILFVTHRAPDRLQPDRIVHLGPATGDRAAA